MVQAADLWQADHLTDLGRHHSPGGGRVLVEGEMRSGAMVVVEVARENSAEMALTKDDDVVEALAPYRAYQSLDEGVLPGRARRARDFLDAHSCESVAEGAGVDSVAVTHQVLRRAAFGERLRPRSEALRRLRAEVGLVDLQGADLGFQGRAGNSQPLRGSGWAEDTPAGRAKSFFDDCLLAYGQAAGHL